MKRRGWAPWLVYRAAGLLWRLFSELRMGWSDAAAHWFLSCHIAFAMKYRFWKVNTRWTRASDQPVFVDA